MIGSPFKITNKADDTLFFEINNQNDSPENFIALQSYPNMDVEIRNEEIVKEGQHGIWDFFSFYGKRTINFEGVIVGNAESNVLMLQQKMLNTTALPSQPETDDDGTVIIEWTDALGRNLQIEGKLQTAIRFGRSMKQQYRLDFIMTFKCPNPTIESQDLTESEGIRSYEMGSLRLPATMPTIVDIIRLNTFTVTNAGSGIAKPIVRMYGSTLFPIHNPRVTNQTTGQFMQINTTLADETKYVFINSKNGAVLDQDFNDLSGFIETGSEFIDIAVGVNTLYYTTSESDPLNPLNPVADRRTPAEVIEVEHRDIV